MTPIELFLKYETVEPTTRSNLFIVTDESDSIGLYDTTVERFVIPFGEYDQIENTTLDGLFEVSREVDLNGRQQKSGVFDLDAQAVVLPVEYTGSIFYFHGGYFAIEDSGTVALFSLKDGRFVIPFEAGFCNFETMERHASLPVNRFLSFSKRVDDESEIYDAVFDFELERMVVPVELEFEEMHFLTPTLFKVWKDFLVGLYNTETGETTWKEPLEKTEDESTQQEDGDGIPF